MVGVGRFSLCLETKIVSGKNLAVTVGPSGLGTSQYLPGTMSPILWSGPAMLGTGLSSIPKITDSSLRAALTCI